MKKVLYRMLLYGILHIPLCVNAMDKQIEKPLHRLSSESSLMSLEDKLPKQTAPKPTALLRPSAISFFVDRNAKTEEWLNDASIALKEKHFYSNETADEEYETIEIRVSVIKMAPILKALFAQQRYEDANPVPSRIPEAVKKILEENNDAHYQSGYDDGYTEGHNDFISALVKKDHSLIKKYGAKVAIGSTAFGLGALTTYLLARHFK